jgi:LPXTG-motif cell wall-anchored protein
MKKNLLLKAAAVLTMLMLALVITVVPGKALADISAATITPGAGQSYNIPVGGTVNLTGAVTGTPLGVVTYSWAQSSGTNVSLSAVTGATTTVTGLVPGTATTITLTASDAGGAPTVVSTSITINVTSMTISNGSLALNGGATQTLTVSNTSSASTTTWTTSDAAVATVSSAGLVTAVGGGTATISATNTFAGGTTQVATCSVTVSPIITISPATQNITAASTAGSIQVLVTYGGNQITTSSAVSWGNSNATAGSLTVAPATLTDIGGGVLRCTATFLSNATGVNASSTVTATIAGAGTYTASRTATVNVRTARYYTLEGDSALNNTDRYGDYTLTLHEANGSVVNDDTSTAHWSWSSSYLSLSSSSINDSRAVMTDGVARIQLYARYNTASSGTRLYAWINDDSNNRVYTTIVITGLSSLPQTGQDMTMIYIMGGAAAALLAAAGVWYGIRKKRTVA